MNDKPDMNAWELQINALLDGELGDQEAEELKAAAEQNQKLASAIIEAYQLQQMMAALPQERAPDSLREKLLRIPAEHGASEASSGAAANRSRNTSPAVTKKTRTWRWFEPRWAMALAAVPLVIALGVNQGIERDVAPTPGAEVAQNDKPPPTDAELEQAREELALAFAYLQKASRVTEREIEYSIGSGMRDPVKENTLRTIADQFDLNEEQET